MTPAPTSMSLTPRTTCGDARWRPSDSPEGTDWLLLGGHLCSELTCRDRRSGRFVDFAKNLNGHVDDRRGAWEPMWVRADRRAGVDTNIECLTAHRELYGNASFDPALGDDRWIVLSVGDDQGWADLCQLMGKPELAQESDFADLLSRQKNHDKIDEIIKEWTSGVDRYDLMHALQGVGIPAGPVLNSKDVHYDPQVKSRGFLERVDYPKERQMGSRMFIGRPYKFSNSPLAIRGPSPTFGQHNEDILQGLLGVDSEAYQGLVNDAVIATVPTTGEATPRIPQEEALQRGRLADWDPDYLQNLGLV